MRGRGGRGRKLTRRFLLSHLAFFLLQGPSWGPYFHNLRIKNNIKVTLLKPVRHELGKGCSKLIISVLHIEEGLRSE